jgi:hypothetical protein
MLRGRRLLRRRRLLLAKVVVQDRASCLARSRQDAPTGAVDDYLDAIDAETGRTLRSICARVLESSRPTQSRGRIRFSADRQVPAAVFTLIVELRRAEIEG